MAFPRPLGLWVNEYSIPSGYVNVAIEHGHRNSGFTQLQNGDFQ